MAKSPGEQLTEKHTGLTHSDGLKVVSHTQREQDEWFINSLMVEGCDVPFKYKRQQKYKNITGQRVNLTYYPMVEKVAGLEFEVMKVVRIRIA